MSKKALTLMAMDVSARKLVWVSVCAVLVYVMGRKLQSPERLSVIHFS